ncbi:MAG: GWxTD domain-containing protein [Bacteroidales bacterium]|jgi:GWxTD domain-containing protein|nr:GWxTD domain-containing protein [Bacteroidales bacterium]
MFLKKGKYYLILFVIIIFSVACSVTRNNFMPRNLFFLYDSYTKNLHPKILIHNTSDTISLLIIKINSEKLRFNEAYNNEELKASLTISYQLLNLKNKNNIVDSTIMHFRINKPKKDSSLIYTIPIKANNETNYLLKIITIDNNKNDSENITLKCIDKTRDIGQNDFLIRKKENNKILFSPFVNNTENFNIYYRKNIIDSMIVLYYRERENIALQPNIISDTLDSDYNIPDSTWIWHADSSNYSYNKKGIYHFCFDSISKQGFSLYNFGETFPNIHTPNELIKPLKYIADSLEQFHPLKDDKLTKLEVDKFWLNRAENYSRVKDLIKIYYNRVINANYYFSSYKAGWKTDRGMIYIVYGLPDGIYRSGETEKWVYNPIGTGPGLVFLFDYKYHAFSTNNFVLNREKLKYTQWDNAVKLWREGKIEYYQK